MTPSSRYSLRWDSEDPLRPPRPAGHRQDAARTRQQSFRKSVDSFQSTIDKERQCCPDKANVWQNLVFHSATAESPLQIYDISGNNQYINVENHCEKTFQGPATTISLQEGRNSTRQDNAMTKVSPGTNLFDLSSPLDEIANFQQNITERNCRPKCYSKPFQRNYIQLNNYNEMVKWQSPHPHSEDSVSRNQNSTDFYFGFSVVHHSGSIMNSEHSSSINHNPNNGQPNALLKSPLHLDGSKRNVGNALRLSKEAVSKSDRVVRESTGDMTNIMTADKSVVKFWRPFEETTSESQTKNVGEFKPHAPVPYYVKLREEFKDYLPPLLTPNGKPNIPFHGSSHSCFKPVKKKRISCKHCQVSFNNTGQLAGHMRVHTGDKPFKCEACAKAFARNEELTRHKRIHSGVRPHACEICKKTFGRKDHLNKHRKTHLKTSEKKVFHCLVSGCGHSYTRSDALTRHQSSAHNIRQCHSNGGRTPRVYKTQKSAGQHSSHTVFQNI